MMEIEFINKKIDFISCKINLSYSNKLLIGFLFVFAFFNTINISNNIEYQVPETSFNIGFFICLFVVYCFFSAIVVVTISIVYAQKAFNQSSCRHKLFLNSKGYIDTTNLYKAEIKWAGVNRIKKFSTYICILGTNFTCLIIPKRDFASNNDFNEFYQKLVEVWNGSKNEPAKP